MRKLKLDLDDLRVDSFDPLPRRTGSHGTVHGQLGGDMGDVYDTYDACDPSAVDSLDACDAMYATRTRRGDRTCGYACSNQPSCGCSHIPTCRGYHSCTFECSHTCPGMEAF